MSRELDDGAVSFKTRAFLQKKELLEALIQGAGGGSRGRRKSGLVCSSDCVRVQGGEIINSTVESGD